MKKVVNVSLGGRNFILNEDAYTRLQDYLSCFKNKLTVPEYQKVEVMEEIEGRIAELFFQEVGEGSRVVTLEMAQKVASALGMPDGSAEGGFSSAGTTTEAPFSRRLYRDVDNKSVAGVCSGLITATLQTRFGVQSILAGIIVNTGLYTVNLAVMGFSSNLSIFGTPTAENMSAFARETYKK